MALVLFPQLGVVYSGTGADEDPLFENGTIVHPTAQWGANTEMRRVSNTYRTDPTTRVGAAEFYGPIGAAGETFEVYLALPVVSTATNDYVGIEMMTTSGAVGVGSDPMSGYWLYLSKSGSGWDLAVGKAVADVNTTLVYTGMASAGDGVGLRLSEGNFRAYKRSGGTWTQILAAVDTTFPGPFFISFAASDAGAGVSTWQLTNVGGGPYDPAPVEDDMPAFPLATELTPSGGGFNQDPASHSGDWTHPTAWWGGPGTEMRYVNGLLRTDPISRVGVVMYTTPIGTAETATDTFLRVAGIGTANGDYVGIEMLTTNPVSDSTPDGYSLWVQRTDGVWEMSMLRYDNGISVPIGTKTIIPLTVNDQIGLRRDGDVISAWHFTNGVWQEVLSVTDANYDGPWYITNSADDVAAGTSVWQLVGFGAAAVFPIEEEIPDPTPQPPPPGNQLPLPPPEPEFPIPPPEEGEITDHPESWSLDASLPDLVDYYDGFKLGRLTKIAPITRGLSDETGNYVGSKTKVEFSDKDRLAMRHRMSDGAAQWVWNRNGTIYLNSEGGRRAQAPPRVLFRGISQDAALTEGFNASIGFEDHLVVQFGRFGPDQTFSRRVFPQAMLAGLPAQLHGLPVQYIFGEVSDKGAKDITGKDIAKGMVPVWHVGTREYQGAVYDEYHLAGHAIKAWELYGSDDGAIDAADVEEGEEPEEESDKVQRILLDLQALGSEGIIRGPYYPGWPQPAPYLDLLNPIDVGGDGKVHRVTHFFVKADHYISEHHKQGICTMAANVCGVEDVGDGSGALIIDLYKQYQFIFEHILLPIEEWTTGLYFQNPPRWFTAEGEIAMLHSESFELCQSISADRIGGTGYRGDFVLCGPSQAAIPLREILRRFSMSGECGFTWTGAGQLKCVPRLDINTSIEDAPIWREPEMIRAWPSPRFAHEEVENPVVFSFDWDDDAQRWRHADLKQTDFLAVRKFGREQPSKSPVEMRCIRDGLTAWDMATRRVHRLSYPPTYYPVKTPLDGVDYDPGDIVRIASQDGIGPRSHDQPFGEEPISLQLHDISYDPKTKTCAMVGLAVDRLLLGGTPFTIRLDPDEFPTIDTLQADGDEDILRLS